MRRRIAARAAAAPAAVRLGMLAAGTGLFAGAAFAMTPAPAQPVWAFGSAPGSTEPERGHESFVALAVEIAGRLDRNRKPDARPAWLTIVGHAPGDAVLAARRAVAVRGALLRAGIAPERVMPLELDPAPPASEPDRAEVASCPRSGGFERWRCGTP